MIRKEKSWCNKAHQKNSFKLTHFYYFFQDHGQRLEHSKAVPCYHCCIFCPYGWDRMSISPSRSEVCFVFDILKFITVILKNMIDDVFLHFYGMAFTFSFQIIFQSSYCAMVEACPPKVKGNASSGSCWRTFTPKWFRKLTPNLSKMSKTPKT